MSYLLLDLHLDFIIWACIIKGPLQEAEKTRVNDLYDGRHEDSGEDNEVYIDGKYMVTSTSNLTFLRIKFKSVLLFFSFKTRTTTIITN